MKTGNRWFGGALLALVSCLAAPAAQQGAATAGAGPGFVPFDPDYGAKARRVRIVPEKEAQTLKAPSMLVRLASGKLALEVRDKSGKPQPFYPVGLATGYWSRQAPTAADLDASFANIAKLGANTVMMGLHWKVIEPEQGKFDFTYTDMVVDVARQHGLKIWWVLFMHAQPPNWPVASVADFWVYHLDSHDGADYTIQWVKDDKGQVYRNIQEIIQIRSEVFPSYSHPKVFPLVLRMLRTLGAHYKDSDTVIALQLGNEEGFATVDWRGRPATENWQSDASPVVQGLFEDWKLKTGKTDWFIFKRDIVNSWWTQFGAAYHEGDPYKLVSFNLMTGGPEAGYEWWIHQSGTDSLTYGKGNMDVIGVMFHRPFNEQMWANLDALYHYPYELPILIPSEIGIDRTVEYFQQSTLATIERGAQGYAVWSYTPNMISKEGTMNGQGVAFKRLADMVQANLDVVHPGLPGPGDVAMQASEGFKVSQLHAAAGTVGMLYFPREYDIKLGTQDWDQVKALGMWQASHPASLFDGKFDVAVKVTAVKAGKYSIQVYKNGAPQGPSTETLQANETRTVTVPGMTKSDVTFVKVKRMP
jgi:hypothetical protein